MCHHIAWIEQMFDSLSPNDCNSRGTDAMKYLFFLASAVWVLLDAAVFGVIVVAVVAWT
jgi:hypothetical protein